eukprot:10013551-Prorocentrum_lima.AAC.1
MVPTLPHPSCPNERVAPLRHFHPDEQLIAQGESAKVCSTGFLRADRRLEQPMRGRVCRGCA